MAEEKTKKRLTFWQRVLYVLLIPRTLYRAFSSIYGFGHGAWGEGQARRKLGENASAEDPIPDPPRSG